MSYFERMDAVHMDILKEIGNIGAGHAATALSKLLNKRIEMTIPDVRIISFDEMMDIVGGADNVVAAVFCVLKEMHLAICFLSYRLSRRNDLFNK